MPETAATIRAAFAAGWATATATATGTPPVPVTERARIACAAAVRVAEASPTSDPGIQPTLQLGQLEGIWAAIYARRQAVERLHGTALANVLNAVKSLDWAGIIDQAGRYLTIDPDLTGTQLAQRLAADIRQAVANDLPAADVQAWRDAMNQAVIDATAEGQTAALALVGDAAGIVIDWNLAATAAQNALADSQVAWATASTWIEQQINGLGYQLSRTVARMWADGDDPAVIESELMDLLTVSRSTAGALLDTTIGQAIATGALNTYAQAGVAYADYLTAGDGRVCPICGEAEDGNSYLLEECPRPPLHVSCRCTVSPSDYQITARGLALVQPFAADSGETDMEAA